MYTVRTSSCHVTSLMSRHVTRSAVATDVVVTLDPRSEDPALQIGAAQAGPNGLTYLKLSSAHVALQLVVLAGRKRAKDTLEGMTRRADQAPNLPSACRCTGGTGGGVVKASVRLPPDSRVGMARAGLKLCRWK